MQRRPDGYHNLETVFHRVDLFDELWAEEAPEITLECDDSALENEENLVVRAARALKERYGVRTGARLLLRKRIPQGAGLGGGSSDAASALGLLSKIWGLSPGPGELSELALSLGSDVPFFLGKTSAHALSRGEHLSPFPLTLPCSIVVVTSPSIRVSTREAFEAIVPNPRPEGSSLRTLVEKGGADPRGFRGIVVNDFEGPIFEAHPAIAAVRDRLDALGSDFSLMSGSGSSVYGLFTDAAAAERAVGAFGAGHPAYVTARGWVPDLSIRRGTPGIN